MARREPRVHTINSLKYLKGAHFGLREKRRERERKREREREREERKATFLRRFHGVLQVGTRQAES